MQITIPESLMLRRLAHWKDSPTLRQSNDLGRDNLADNSISLLGPAEADQTSEEGALDTFLEDRTLRIFKGYF